METRIMIVDGDNDVAINFKTGLEMDGFKVHIFNDPIKTLPYFKKGLYDLIILDIKMPKMNGFELGRE
jgi:two-component system, OmpR family, response regulator ChvI